MDDELDPTEFLRSVSEWKQNTGSMPSGADLERLAVNFYRQSGGPLSERAADYTRSQRAEYSDVPQPDDMRKDLNPILGAIGSAATGLERSLATGGDVWSRVGDAVQYNLDTRLGIPTKKELDKSRGMADEYAQENFLAGRVPGAVGGLGGLIANLSVLSKVPGLGGHGATSGAVRFGTEQAIVPEIQAGARGEQSRSAHFVPIGQGEDSTTLERMGGRFGEGMLLDAILRGSGKVLESTVGRAIPKRAAEAFPRVAERVPPAIGQAGALGALGAAQAPEGQRLEEAGAMGLIGLVSGGAGKRFPPRGKAEGGSVRVDPAGPEGPFRESDFSGKNRINIKVGGKQAVDIDPNRPEPVDADVVRGNTSGESAAEVPGGTRARRPGSARPVDDIVSSMEAMSQRQVNPEDIGGIKQSFQDEVARDYLLQRRGDAGVDAIARDFMRSRAEPAVERTAQPTEQPTGVDRALPEPTVRVEQPTFGVGNAGRPGRHKAELFRRLMDGDHEAALELAARAEARGRPDQANLYMEQAAAIEHAANKKAKANRPTAKREEDISRRLDESLSLAERQEQMGDLRGASRHLRTAEVLEAQLQLIRGGGAPKRRVPLSEIGDPLWKEMVRGDRPSYLIPGEGNPALLTAGERAFKEPSPKALAAAGIVPVDVPGVGRLYANTNHPLFAGKEDIPGFVRSMKEQGREGEVLGYTESADQTKATHIVTAIGKDGKEVASVRTTDPIHEATALENVDGIVETVVRQNTPESVVKINEGRLGEMVSEQQAPKVEPVAEQPVATKPKQPKVKVYKTTKEDIAAESAAQKKRFAEAQAKADAENSARKEVTDGIDGFADDKPPHVRQRIVSTLKRTVSRDGKIVSRRDMIRELNADGYKAGEREGKPAAVGEDGRYTIVTATERDYLGHLNNKQPKASEPVENVEPPDTRGNGDSSLAALLAEEATAISESALTARQSELLAKGIDRRAEGTTHLVSGAQDGGLTAAEWREVTGGYSRAQQAEDLVGIYFDDPLLGLREKFVGGRDEAALAKLLLDTVPKDTIFDYAEGDVFSALAQGKVPGDMFGAQIEPSSVVAIGRRMDNILRERTVGSDTLDTALRKFVDNIVGGADGYSEPTRTKAGLRLVGDNPSKPSNVSRETPTTKPTSSSSSADVARWVRSLDGLSTADRSHLANLGLKSGKTKTGWFVNIPGEGRITVDSGKATTEVKPAIPQAEPPAPKPRPKKPVKTAPREQSISESRKELADIQRKIAELGPEPHKPSSAVRALGARRAGVMDPSDPHTADWIAANKGYNTWRRKVSSLLKAQTEVSNRIYHWKKSRDIHTDESGAIDMGRFVDLAKKAVKRTKIEMTDPAKSHELDVEASKRARGKASELIAAVGEATGQRKTARWLTHVTGLPHADPLVRNLEAAMDVFGDKSEARFNQLQEKASRLPAEREREFWLKAEKMESAPKGDPLHDLLIEHVNLVRDQGEAMVRAGEFSLDTAKQIRANAAKLPKGKDRNELRRLAVELQRAARLTRERLEHYNRPGESGYVTRFAPQPKGKDGGAKFFARVMAKLRSPGIGDMAKGVEKAARDAYRQRKDLTPEEAEAAGYAVGLMPLVRTWQRATKIHTTFSTLEYAAKAPEFKPYIRTPSGKLDKSGEWILAKGPGFGALQGKEIHHSLYGLMETMTPKGRNGLVDLMRAASGGLKEGSTVQRIPGYAVKALSGENPLAVWMGGMSPWKFAGRLKTSIPETKRFWLDGKQDAATKLLVDIGLARQSVGMIDSLDTTRGSGIATSTRVSKGTGKEYWDEVKRRFIDHLAERIAAIPENTSISSASRLAEVWNTVRESATNFDYSRIVGADVSVKPGTFAREAAAISDFVWKHALASELLATGGAGPARMLAQKATGTPTRGMTPAQVSKVLRDFYDPSRLAPWAKAVSNFPVVYDFVRYPLMHTRNLAPASIGGGGHWKRSPIGTAFGVAPARAITVAFTAYLVSQGMSVEEAEELVDEAANQATGGDEDQKALIAPMMMTEDEDGKPVIRFGVFGQALGLESTFRNPAYNVVGNPEESPIGRFFRGLASTSPLGSKLYELSGRDNYLGGQIRSQDPATWALELTKGLGLPNATAQQWTRRAAKRERAEDMGQDPDVRGGTIGETLFRSLSGFGTRTGYDEDTDKGAAQKSFRRFIEEQAKDMEASRSGAKFSPEMRMPEKYRDDDSPEETARKRKLWKHILSKNPGLRRRLGIE